MPGHLFSRFSITVATVVPLTLTSSAPAVNRRKGVGIRTRTFIIGSFLRNENAPARGSKAWQPSFVTGAVIRFDIALNGGSQASWFGKFDRIDRVPLGSWSRPLAG